MTRMVYCVLAIIFAVIAAAYLYGYLRQVYKISQIKKWPERMAMVTTSVVGKKELMKGVTYHPASSVPGSNSAYTQYFPKIEYRFELNGVLYTGSDYSYTSTSTTDLASVNAAVAKMPKGSEVIIHYNPKNPKESYIVPGTISKSNLVIAVVLFLVAGGFWYLAKMYRAAEIPVYFDNTRTANTRYYKHLVS